MRAEKNACPLCGARTGGDNIPDELMEAARRHLEEPAEELSPLPFLPASTGKMFLAVLGIPIGLIAGMAACFAWLFVSFGLGTGAFVAAIFTYSLLGAFGVGFVIGMGAWLLAFRIWPFHRG
jgi:hypothetical protein